jgi:hypothetical protein
MAAIPPTPPSPPWKNNPVRDLLMQDIRTGVVDGLRPAQVYNSRAEYCSTSRQKFASRLSSLRKQVNTQLTSARADSAALEHDRQLYPIQPIGSNGMPRWQGSEAESVLLRYIDNNLQTTNTPRQLYLSHPAFQAFTLEMFRKHIYQEIKKRKFIVQYSNRN